MTELLIDIGNMEKAGRYSTSNYKGTMGVLKREKQDKAMLCKLGESNVTWDWNVSRKYFKAKLRPTGRISGSVSRSKWHRWAVDAWGDSVPGRRLSLSICPELGESILPSGNERLCWTWEDTWEKPGKVSRATHKSLSTLRGGFWHFPKGM